MSLFQPRYMQLVCSENFKFDTLTTVYENSIKRNTKHMFDIKK